MVEKSPSTLAREALKLLFSREQPPTPENYQAAYHEVAGTMDAIVVPPGLAHQLARLCEFAQPLHTAMSACAKCPSSWCIFCANPSPS